MADGAADTVAARAAAGAADEAGLAVDAAAAGEGGNYETDIKQKFYI